MSVISDRPLQYHAGIYRTKHLVSVHEAPIMFPQIFLALNGTEDVERLGTLDGKK